MTAWRVDVVQAFRLIGRQQAFSAFAILILACGTGAATAVFMTTLAVSALASYVPARRAGRVAPVELLRG